MTKIMKNRCLHDYKNAIPVGKVDHICPLCKKLLDPGKWFFMNYFMFTDVGKVRTKIENINIPDEGQLKITRKDLKNIFGNDFREFEEKVIPNCWCYKCNSKSGASTIENFKIFLNDLDDIVLRGFCTKCGSRVDRYIETGEVEKYKKVVNVIRAEY